MDDATQEDQEHHDDLGHEHVARVFHFDAIC